MKQTIFKFLPVSDGIFPVDERCVLPDNLSCLLFQPDIVYEIQVGLF